jgi:hypothetical protein
MDKTFRDNPEEFWRDSLVKYRKIVGKPEAIDPVANIKQIDREGVNKPCMRSPNMADS